MLRSPSNVAMRCPILALATAIFVIDAIRPFDIAVAELYVIVTLLSVRVWARRGQLLVISACMALTVLAYLSFHLAAFPGPDAGRCLVSLGVLGIAGWLAVADRAAAIEDAHANRAGIGLLTASIAHEVSQPLAAISMNGHACLRWIDRSEPNLPEARASVARMLEACRRADDTIGCIRAMAACADQQPLPVAPSHFADVDERAQLTVGPVL